MMLVLSWPVLVYHEIIPQHLERVHEPVRVELVACGPEGIRNQPFDLWHYMLYNIYLRVGMVLV